MAKENIGQELRKVESEKRKIEQELAEKQKLSTDLKQLKDDKKKLKQLKSELHPTKQRKIAKAIGLAFRGLQKGGHFYMENYKRRHQGELRSADRSRKEKLKEMS